ncbi:uncharacterized protein LOC107359646 isoform X2 [Tetranychus urticae]|uniref:uncharacterized protein LOC107359646 isoform X2 n=1 Tax=Tetranychus urticae TaxID=32264 RepID=UPI000D6588C2|nr:uncharacterized protein LOC107359646 isoform X2 [Tetranychus urticae]
MCTNGQNKLAWLRRVRYTAKYQKNLNHHCVLPIIQRKAMGLTKFSYLLFLPILVSECFFNPFRWRQNTNCDSYNYNSVQSHMPYNCGYQQLTRPYYPQYQSMMETMENYPYYGMHQPFKPFMISGQQQYYGSKSPSYYPNYYYNSYSSLDSSMANGYSKSWPYSSFQPSVQVPPPVSKVNTQQIKLKSY